MWIEAEVTLARGKHGACLRVGADLLPDDAEPVTHLQVLTPGWSTWELDGADMVRVNAALWAEHAAELERREARAKAKQLASLLWTQVELALELDTDLERVREYLRDVQDAVLRRAA